MSGFSFGTPFSKPAVTSNVSSFSFGSLSSSVIPQSTSSSSVTTPVFSGASGFSFGSFSAPTASTVVSTVSNSSSAANSLAPLSGFQFGAFGSTFASTTTATALKTSPTLPSAALNSPFILSPFGTKLSDSTAKTTASTVLPQSSFSLGLNPTSVTSSLLSFGASSVPSALSTPTSTYVSSNSLSNFSALAKPSPPAPFSLSTSISTTANAPTSSIASPFAFSLLKPTEAPISSAVLSSSTLTTFTSSPLGSNSLTKNVSGSAAEAITTKPEPTLTFRQLEDMVNKWTYELDEQERNFSSELNRLNKADCILIENADKISSLHSKVETCKTGQDRIEQELDFIESQQRELESLLEPLEQAATDLPPSQQHADLEREAIFQMCTNTDLELGQLLNDLRDMADQVNSINSDFSQTGGGDVSEKRDPLAKSGSVNVIGQVTRILNSHMHSLSWLNQNTQELIERMKFINSP